MPGKKPDDLNYQYEISDDFTELGELLRDIGDIKRAKECRLQEIEIYRNIHEKDPEDEVSEANIAATLDQLGHLYAEKGETGKLQNSTMNRDLEPIKNCLNPIPEILTTK